jgi:voltage-gated chloride channel
MMDAIDYNNGKIRPIVAVIKSLASTLSIGSGGSVGREGPIIQIGVAFGSTLGQLITMPVRQGAILIAAGAGGSIAARFNTSIGGIAFAVELMLPTQPPESPIPTPDGPQMPRTKLHALTDLDRHPFIYADTPTRRHVPPLWLALSSGSFCLAG